MSLPKFDSPLPAKKLRVNYQKWDLHKHNEAYVNVLFGEGITPESFQKAFMKAFKKAFKSPAMNKPSMFSSETPKEDYAFRALIAFTIDTLGLKSSNIYFPKDDPVKQQLQRALDKVRGNPPRNSADYFKSDRNYSFSYVNAHGEKNAHHGRIVSRSHDRIELIYAGQIKEFLFSRMVEPMSSREVNPPEEVWKITVDFASTSLHHGATVKLVPFSYELRERALRKKPKP